MSSELEPALWSRDTGHIGIHGGKYGRTVTKTKFSRTDKIPYFLTCGAPRVLLVCCIVTSLVYPCIICVFCCVTNNIVIKLYIYLTGFTKRYLIICWDNLAL